MIELHQLMFKFGIVLLPLVAFSLFVWLLCATDLWDFLFPLITLIFFASCILVVIYSLITGDFVSMWEAIK